MFFSSLFYLWTDNNERNLNPRTSILFNERLENRKLVLHPFTENKLEIRKIKNKKSWIKEESN